MKAWLSLLETRLFVAVWRRKHQRKRLFHCIVGATSWKESSLFIKRLSRQTNDYCPWWQAKRSICLPIFCSCRQRHHQNRNNRRENGFSRVSTMGAGLKSYRIPNTKLANALFPRFIWTSQADWNPRKVLLSLKKGLEDIRASELFSLILSLISFISKNLIFPLTDSKLFCTLDKTI